VFEKFAQPSSKGFRKRGGKKNAPCWPIKPVINSEAKSQSLCRTRTEQKRMKLETREMNNKRNRKGDALGVGGASRTTDLCHELSYKNVARVASAGAPGFEENTLSDCLDC